MISCLRAGITTGNRWIIGFNLAEIVDDADLDRAMEISFAVVVDVKKYDDPLRFIILVQRHSG